MISMTIHSNGAEVGSYLVEIQGQLQHRAGLNNALGKRLERVLQEHFRSRQAESNKLDAPKSGFWEAVAADTILGDVTEDGATVTVAEPRVLPHIFGATIRPTGGRKFLTIPLIAEARGLPAAVYESQSGRKLFRLPGRKVLVERSDKADRFMPSASKATIRGKDGYRKITVGGGSLIRAVYALKEQVTIKKDPRALPDDGEVVAALLDEGSQWLARHQDKGGEP